MTYSGSEQPSDPSQGLYLSFCRNSSRTAITITKTFSKCVSSRLAVPTMATATSALGAVANSADELESSWKLSASPVLNHASASPATLGTRADPENCWKTLSTAIEIPLRRSL